MSEFVRFWLPGEVLPKQSLIMNSRGQPVRDVEVVKNASTLGAQARPYRPSEPYTGPVGVALLFEYPWLQSHSGKAKQANAIIKTTFPDIDNLIKQVLDVFQRVGMFVNDSQVQIDWAWKYYTGRQGVWCRIRQIPVSELIERWWDSK